ncbi:hypothetical protein BFP97_06355 [Roseivirga sp. 4D4]|nr:hypothetical protein BFP97_06355 [Roseivirga sp. 4D4]
MRALIENVCGGNIEIIKRPASFIVKNKDEGARTIERLIVLPPKGYTADTPTQTNSHDEAERATIEIKGGVRPDKNGFSTLKHCLLVASFNKESGFSDLDKPYMTYSADLKSTPGLFTEFHSAGESPFTVVKPNGYGFYHNLVNVTDDWLVLKLNKRLRLQKGVELDPFLENLTDKQAKAVSTLHDNILADGDALFKKYPDLVDEVASMPPQTILPALGEMLFVYDSGKHEACSVFALILKIGKLHMDKTKEFLTDALEKNAIPAYYGEQLIGKLMKHRQGLESSGDSPEFG